MIIEPLNDQHNRFAFSCGNDKLDRYLQEIAHQAKRKGLAATFVAVNGQDPAKILGYYSLSSYMVEGLEIPEVLRKKRKLSAKSVGATLLGRLAVAADCQSQGIGTYLLADALKRAYSVSGDVAAACVIVDAIEESKVGFYEKFGFVRVAPESLRLVIMMDTIAQLLPGVATETKEAI